MIVVFIVALMVTIGMVGVMYGTDNRGSPRSGEQVRADRGVTW
jgi:hypothetical protein